MEFVWQTIQGVGAVVGLVTGLFVVWDRFIRMTPAAVVYPRRLSESSAFKTLYLQVRNPADRPILLTWRNGLHKGVFGLVADDSTRSVVESVLDGKTTVVVDAGASRDFRLHKPQDIAEIGLDDTVDIKLSWRYAQPKLWRRDRRIRVRIQKRSLAAMAPDEYDDSEEV